MTSTRATFEHRSKDTRLSGAVAEGVFTLQEAADLARDTQPEGGV